MVATIKVPTLVHCTKVA